MAGFIDGIKSLSEINKGLQDLNKALTDILEKLERIKGVSADVAKNTKQATSKGGQRGNADSGKKQMSGSLAPVTTPQTEMPKAQNMPTSTMSRTQLFMEYGGADVIKGVGQTIFGAAAGLYAAMPSTATVATNSLGYYQASLGLGINPMRVQQQTFQDLRGGFSSVGSGAAAAASLRSVGMMPGTAQFRQSMAEVGGAFRYMGMENEAAAQAIANLHTGPSAAKLYSVGVLAVDPRTGKPNSTANIATQLYRRMFGGQKVTQEELQRSIQYGAAGANLRALGYGAAETEMFKAMFTEIAAGRDPNLATKGYGNKALEALGVSNTAESETIMKKQDAYLEGMVQGAEYVKNFNKALQQVPDAVFQFKGALDTFTSSTVGGGTVAALTAAFGGLTTAVGGLLTLLGVRAGIAALGAGTGATGGAAAAAAGAGALRTAGGAILKGAGRLGMGALAYTGMEKGQEWLNENFGDSPISGIGNFMYDLAQGAIAGFLTAGPWGALAGAGATGTGSLMNPYQKGPTGGSDAAPSLKPGSGSSGSSSSPTLPVGNARVSSPYGMRKVPALYGDNKERMHRGTDYAVPIGTPVKAAKDGTVQHIGLNESRYEGWHIILDHGGGWDTLYAHLKSVNVKVGQSVKQGQIIGHSGTAGTGPHLHFEVRQNGVQVDPSRFMTGATSSFKVTKYDKNGKEISTVFHDTTVETIGSGALSFYTIGTSGVQGSPVTLSGIYGRPGSTVGFASTTGTLGTIGESKPGTSWINDAKDSGSYRGGGNAPRKYSPGYMLPQKDLLSILYRAGFTKVDDMIEAYATAMTESNGRPSAYNPDRTTGDDSYGLFQINMLGQLGVDRRRILSRYGVKRNEDLLDPYINARSAAHFSQRGANWKSWKGGTEPYQYAPAKYKDRYNRFLMSVDEMKDARQDAGLPVGGGGDASMASMVGSTGTGISNIRVSRGGTTINHAGNTVNINVQVTNGSEKEAYDFAKRVKNILENDFAINAIGSQ